MTADRIGVIKNLHPDVKKQLKQMFEDNDWGEDKLWAIGLLFNVNGQIDLRMYNSLLDIKKYNDDVLIWAGETRYLNGEEKTDE